MDRKGRDRVTSSESRPRSRKRYKSLLIIGIPRTGSTALERACHKMLACLGFESDGEIFNPSFYQDLSGVTHNTRSKKYYEVFKAKCKERRHNHVIRDVVQSRFIITYANTLKQWFNIIFILRPERETKLCCKLKGWTANIGWMRKLIEIPCGKSMKLISYNDFVLLDPHKLYSILRKWYPCEEVDYMTPEFIGKREATFTKLGCHGVVPECILRKIHTK